MCGIAGIISKKNGHSSISQTIAAMADALAHRGPDGEGFLFSDGQTAQPLTRQPFNRQGLELNYLPQQTFEAVSQSHTIAFAHRRLSILDLSAAGHEPMCDASGRLWITFNGEIYNYRELRDELRKAGHQFRSQCDTEVILYAYKEWGAACAERFNGMWAFCILDLDKKICFASRDRFGVKPFYYADHAGFFAFASEQKAFVRSGLLPASIREEALHNYVVNGMLETSAQNFFGGVTELWPGENLVYDLASGEVKTTTWFSLQPTLANDQLDEAQLITGIRTRLDQSVRLRLRSDVEVGTCLSGGIDSSALALLISRHTGKTFHCFTAAFPGRPFDESHFAATVATRAGAIHHVTEPTVSDLEADFDDLIYSQDTPIWDTSTYAQHRVMRLAREHHIKVVLDGQGADELFTGYHHHFVARWNGLFAAGRWGQLARETAEARVSLDSPRLFYLKERLKARMKVAVNKSGLLREDFVNRRPVFNHAQMENEVNAQLIRDITHTRLKIFLKCEDRCGMWHGVESRTPFSDDPDLIEWMFSFSGHRKIRHGRLKYLLREAMKDDLPTTIYNRFDKRGFETPMQAWVERMKPRMLNAIRDAQFDFVNPGKLKTGPAAPKTNQLMFRLYVLATWRRVFGG